MEIGLGRLKNLKLPKFLSFKLGMFKGKEVVGLDIGSHSVKLVQLSGKPGKYGLTNFGVEEISPEAMIGEESPETDELLINAISRFISRWKVTTKNVVTAISGNSVVVRYVDFPKMKPDDLEKSLQFEAEPYVPFDIREACLDFQILEDMVTEDGERKMRTLLVAARRDLLDLRINLLSRLGLNPQVIDVDALALGNAWGMNNPLASPEEIVALVNIGARTTNINIMEGSTSRFVRDVFIAGNSFTRAIQRNLQVDYKTAEEMKKKGGLIVADESMVSQLVDEEDPSFKTSRILSPVVGDLLNEVKRSLEFYYSQSTKEKTVSRVILSGGSANLGNLDSFFSAALKCPVEINNPFSNIDLSRISNTSMLEEAGPLFTIASGLAVRQRGDRLT